MPAERLPMRQVREVLRLKHVCGQSGHRIAAAIGISRYTVAEYLRRAAVMGITWPVPPELDDTALERKLFTPPGAMAAETVRPQPNWVRIHAEMRRTGVTLLLLWEEYRAGQPEGDGYSRYVAAVLMLRLVARARDTVGNPGSIRNIEIAYKAFRNATNDGRERRSGRAFSPLRSTLARALAFIWRSTSA